MSTSEKQEDISAAGRVGELPLVPAEVPSDLLEVLLDMGFQRNRAIRALHFSGSERVEDAITWLDDNQDAEDLDAPLFVKPKKELSPEEKRRQVEEIRQKAKAHREKEEKEADRVRERERIRMGKEMQEAEKKQKKQELQKMVDFRKREKEADRVAKEKIRLKLEEDRKERRVKLGLPADLTPEEKAKEEAKKEAKAKEEADRLTRHTSFAKPVGITEDLRHSLVNIKKSADDAPFKAACALLLKIVGNVVKSPNEEKFRRIRLSGASFQQKIASLKGGIDFLIACGFECDAAGEFLVMSRNAVNLEALNAAGTVLDSAVNNPFFGQL